MTTFFGKGSTSIIQPILSGTAYKRVVGSKEPTMFTFDHIELPLLSFGAVLNLFEEYARSFGNEKTTNHWKTCHSFLYLLSDMGGKSPLFFSFPFLSFPFLSFALNKELQEYYSNQSLLDLI